MELDLMHQIYQAAGAWLLGIAAGAYYDVLRTIRRRTKKRAATTALDIIFWIGLAGALFAQTMTMGRGEVRIFMLVTNALGTLVYFLVLSGPVLFVLGKILDKVLKITKFIREPICKIWAKGKKLAKREKDDFKNFANHCIIRYTHLHNTKRSAKKGGEQLAQKGEHIYQTGSTGTGRLRGVQSGQPPRANRGRESGEGHHGRNRRRVDARKRHHRE